MTPTRPHLALVGLMGTGKTTVGRRVAKLLDRPFVDADEAFVPRYGRTVSEVFAAEGEEGFRRREAGLLGELLAVTTPLVLGCGGGVVTVEGNRRRLCEPDVHVVWLRADAAFLASRVEAKPDRPLLAGGDRRAVLERLAAERAAFYQEVADDVVDVEVFAGCSQPKKAMAAHIAERARALGVPG